MVRVYNGVDGRQKLLLEGYQVVGSMQILKGSVDKPQGCINTIEVGGIAVVIEAIWNHTVVRSPGKGGQNRFCFIEPSGFKQQAGQCYKGIPAPVCEPREAGQNRYSSLVARCSFVRYTRRDKLVGCETKSSKFPVPCSRGGNYIPAMLVQILNRLTNIEVRILNS